MVMQTERKKKEEEQHKKINYIDIYKIDYML